MISAKCIAISEPVFPTLRRQRKHSDRKADHYISGLGQPFSRNAFGFRLGLGIRVVGSDSGRVLSDPGLSGLRV